MKARSTFRGMPSFSWNWVFPRFDRVLNRGGPYDPENLPDRFLWPVCCQISQNRARTEGVNSIPPAFEVRALRRRCLDSLKNPGNVKRVVAKARDGIRVFVISIPAMLASGGYPWAVIRVEDRDVYMAALESASIGRDIGGRSRSLWRTGLRGHWGRRREQLDAPSFPEPVRAALFEDDGAAFLVWNRWGG